MAEQIANALGVPRSKLPLARYATEADRGAPFAFKRHHRGADERPGTSQQPQEPPEPQSRMGNQIPTHAIRFRVKRKMPIDQACARKEPNEATDTGQACVQRRELAVCLRPCSPVLYNPRPWRLPAVPLSWTHGEGPTLMLSLALRIRISRQALDTTDTKLLSR